VQDFRQFWKLFVKCAASDFRNSFSLSIAGLAFIVHWKFWECVCLQVIRFQGVTWEMRKSLWIIPAVLLVAIGAPYAQAKCQTGPGAERSGSELPGRPMPAERGAGR
jgi:hypothetical protein